MFNYSHWRKRTQELEAWFSDMLPKAVANLYFISREAPGMDTPDLFVEKSAGYTLLYMSSQRSREYARLFFGWRRCNAAEEIRDAVAGIMTIIDEELDMREKECPTRNRSDSGSDYSI